MRVEREADSRPCKRDGVFISYFCITVSRYQTETCQRMVFILIHFQKDFFPVWQERHSRGSASFCAGWRIEQRFFLPLWTRNKTQAQSKGRSNSQTPAPCDLLLPPRIHFLGVFPQAAKEFPKAGDWAFKAWGSEGAFQSQITAEPSAWGGGCGKA